MFLQRCRNQDRRKNTTPVVRVISILVGVVPDSLRNHLNLESLSSVSTKSRSRIEATGAYVCLLTQCTKQQRSQIYQTYVSQIEKLDPSIAAREDILESPEIIPGEKRASAITMAFRTVIANTRPGVFKFPSRPASGKFLTDGRDRGEPTAAEARLRLEVDAFRVANPPNIYRDKVNNMICGQCTVLPWTVMYMHGHIACCVIGGDHRSGIVTDVNYPGIFRDHVQVMLQRLISTEVKGASPTLAPFVPPKTIQFVASSISNPGSRPWFPNPGDMDHIPAEIANALEHLCNIRNTKSSEKPHSVEDNILHNQSKTNTFELSLSKEMSHSRVHERVRTTHAPDGTVITDKETFEVKNRLSVSYTEQTMCQTIKSIKLVRESATLSVNNFLFKNSLEGNSKNCMDLVLAIEDRYRNRDAVHFRHPVLHRRVPLIDRVNYLQSVSVLQLEALLSHQLNSVSYGELFSDASQVQSVDLHNARTLFSESPISPLDKLKILTSLLLPLIYNPTLNPPGKYILSPKTHSLSCSVRGKLMSAMIWGNTKHPSTPRDFLDEKEACSVPHAWKYTQGYLSQLPTMLILSARKAGWAKHLPKAVSGKPCFLNYDEICPQDRARFVAEVELNGCHVTQDFGDGSHWIHRGCIPIFNISDHCHAFSDPDTDVCEEASYFAKEFSQPNASVADFLLYRFRRYLDKSDRKFDTEVENVVRSIDVTKDTFKEKIPVAGTANGLELLSELVRDALVSENDLGIFPPLRSGSSVLLPSEEHLVHEVLLPLLCPRVGDKDSLTPLWAKSARSWYSGMLNAELLYRCPTLAGSDSQQLLNISNFCDTGKISFQRVFPKRAGDPVSVMTTMPTLDKTALFTRSSFRHFTRSPTPVTEQERVQREELFKEHDKKLKLYNLELDKLIQEYLRNESGDFRLYIARGLNRGDRTSQALSLYAKYVARNPCESELPRSEYKSASVELENFFEKRIQSNQIREIVIDALAKKGCLPEPPPPCPDISQASFPFLPNFEDFMAMAGHVCICSDLVGSVPLSKLQHADSVMSRLRIEVNRFLSRESKRVLPDTPISPSTKANFTTKDLNVMLNPLVLSDPSLQHYTDLVRLRVALEGRKQLCKTNGFSKRLSDHAECQRTLVKHAQQLSDELNRYSAAINHLHHVFVNGINRQCRLQKSETVEEEIVKVCEIVAQMEDVYVRVKGLKNYFGAENRTEKLTSTQLQHPRFKVFPKLLTFDHLRRINNKSPQDFDTKVATEIQAYYDRLNVFGNHFDSLPGCKQDRVLDGLRQDLQSVVGYLSKLVEASVYLLPSLDPENGIFAVEQDVESIKGHIARFFREQLEPVLDQTRDISDRMVDKSLDKVTGAIELVEDCWRKGSVGLMPHKLFESFEKWIHDSGSSSWMKEVLNYQNEDLEQKLIPIQSDLKSLCNRDAQVVARQNALPFNPEMDLNSIHTRLVALEPAVKDSVRGMELLSTVNDLQSRRMLAITCGEDVNDDRMLERFFGLGVGSRGWTLPVPDGKCSRRRWTVIPLDIARAFETMNGFAVNTAKLFTKRDQYSETACRVSNNIWMPVSFLKWSDEQARTYDQFIYSVMAKRGLDPRIYSPSGGPAVACVRARAALGLGVYVSENDLAMKKLLSDALDETLVAQWQLEQNPESPTLKEPMLQNPIPVVSGDRTSFPFHSSCEINVVDKATPVPGFAPVNTNAQEIIRLVAKGDVVPPTLATTWKVEITPQPTLPDVLRIGMAAAKEADTVDANEIVNLKPKEALIALGQNAPPNLKPLDKLEKDPEELSRLANEEKTPNQHMISQDLAMAINKRDPSCHYVSGAFSGKVFNNSPLFDQGAHEKIIKDSHMGIVMCAVGSAFRSDPPRLGLADNYDHLRAAPALSFLESVHLPKFVKNTAATPNVPDDYCFPWNICLLVNYKPGEDTGITLDDAPRSSQRRLVTIDPTEGSCKERQLILEMALCASERLRKVAKEFDMWVDMKIPNLPGYGDAINLLDGEDVTQLELDWHLCFFLGWFDPTRSTYQHFKLLKWAGLNLVRKIIGNEYRPDEIPHKSTKDATNRLCFKHECTGSLDLRKTRLLDLATLSKICRLPYVRSQLKVNPESASDVQGRRKILINSLLQIRKDVSAHTVTFRSIQKILSKEARPVNCDTKGARASQCGR